MTGACEILASRFHPASAPDYVPVPHLRDLQLNRLQAVVWRAYRNVELFRSRLRQRGLDPDDIRSLEDLARLPLVLSEAGVDRAGNSHEDGWVSRGSADDYERWLRWFDAELRKDPSVVGATLFASGGFESWPSFELEAFLPRLTRMVEEGRR